jgi:hypothetical protein
MRNTLIILFEPTPTLALIPTTYAPAEFSYNSRTFIQAHGPGTVFLDWLLTSEGELIGIQLSLDIFSLDSSGHSTLTKEEEETRRIAAHKNFSRDYISKRTRSIQLWFGRRRDFNPQLSCHQDMVDCNYSTLDMNWAVGISVNSDDEIIQKLTRVEAKWVSNEIHVLGNWVPPPD